MGFWKEIDEQVKQNQKALADRNEREQRQLNSICEDIEVLKRRISALEAKAKVVCPTCGDLHETKTWKEGTEQCEQ